MVPSVPRKRSSSCTTWRPVSSIASFMISRPICRLARPAASTRPSGELWPSASMWRSLRPCDSTSFQMRSVSSCGMTRLRWSVQRRSSTIATATTEHTTIGHMTGPPARMISHMARHDTVRPRPLPAGPTRPATSAWNRAAPSRFRRTSGSSEKCARMAPSSAVTRTVVPAALQRATTSLSGMPQRLPKPADAIPIACRCRRDQLRGGRAAAPVMRQQHQVSRERLRHEFRLGRGFRVRQQECRSARPGDFDRAGSVVVTAVKSGGRVQHAKRDPVPLPGASPDASGLGRVRVARRRHRSRYAKRPAESGLPRLNGPGPRGSRQAGQFAGFRARASTAAARRVPPRHRRASVDRCRTREHAGRSRRRRRVPGPRRLRPG